MGNSNNMNRKKVILLLVAFVSIGIAVGVGIGIGYAAFNKKEIMSCKPCDQGISSSNGTTPESSTRPTQNSSPHSDPSTLTRMTNTVPTTTTTQIFLPCPPTLSEPTKTKIILTLDETNAPSVYAKYSISYDSPTDATTAMLMFEFSTVWGSWYVDDVSIKQGSSSGPEMIDNGGFETGNLGSKWKFCDPRYSWLTEGTVVSHSPHSGTYSYESQDPAVGSQEYLTQIFNIQGNTRYTIEFYLFYIGQPTSVEVTLISH